MRPKTKNFALNQTHFGRSPLARFTKKFPAAFVRFTRAKTKLFAVKFRQISEIFPHGRIFTILGSKHEAVCYCVQMHFGNIRLMMFTTKVLGAFFDFCIQNQNCLLRSSNAFWTFSACKVYNKISWPIFAMYVSKNEAVFREVQTHLGSSWPASFTERILGAITRFMGPNTKLFAMKIRHIMEVFALPGL